MNCNTEYLTFIIFQKMILTSAESNYFTNSQLSYQGEWHVYKKKPVA